MFFFLFKLKRKKFFFQPKEHFFFRRSSVNKVSFTFLFLLQKQIFCKSLNTDFFFFNNLCLLFLKKIVEVVHVYKHNIFFYNSQCLKFSNVGELNFCFSKKDYLFYKFLQKTDCALIINVFKRKSFKVIFLSRLAARRNLRHLLNQPNLCGLLYPEMSPDLCFFFLPMLLNETFSVFFYKFFFYEVFASI